MAHRPIFINQVACNLGFLTHPTVGLFLQYVFTTESFLGYKITVEIPKYIVQRSVNMNAAGAAGLQEQLRDTSTSRDGRTVCIAYGVACLLLFKTQS